MRKLFIILTLILLPTLAVAQNRGILKNVISRWYNLSANTTQTLSLSPPSRDLHIYNGATTAICVGLKGATIDASCTTTSNITQIDANSTLDLYDFETDSITLLSLGAAASPVSVVVTY
jgi:hypothetical protein